VVAGSFTVGGTRYTFGEVGTRLRLFIVITPDRNNPVAETDTAGHLIQLGSGS
jgi:hypothetical protein